METSEIVLSVLLGCGIVAVGIYLALWVMWFFLLPWSILLHLFSLGTIPMMEPPVNPLRWFRKDGDRKNP